MIYILEQNNRRYKVAIHFATSAGNNSAGKSWKACALSSGMIGSTILEVGVEPGNISQAVYDSIIAGDTIEIVRTIAPGTNPTIASVNALCDILVSEYQAGMAGTLKYYGYTIEGA